jgi:alpha-L-rhamnosidase
VIYDMINQDDKPGYGYQLKKGATALTEAWDANTNASHNHFMLGQIIEWYYKHLVGINFDESSPGFKHIVIAPEPAGDLEWAKATYKSIRGDIACMWRREGEQLTLTVTIPANTTATVHVPAKSANGITESGKPAATSEGVKFVRQEGDRAVYDVESGKYEFHSTY